MDDIEKLPTYKFSSFSEEMARKAFGLKPHLSEDGFLTEWLGRAATQTINIEEQRQLDRFQRKLKLFVRSWNEQELRERFIVPVIELVDFDLYDLEVVSFAERPMQVTYNKSIIQGKVEWMVASGLFEPEHPFFFVHEYKREKDASSDPVGQLLATLFTAKTLNSQQKKVTLFNPTPTSFENIPLYGTYITGRFWFFVRLKNNKYYISEAYNSTEVEDLQSIFKLLKAQKEMIIELVHKLRAK